MNGAKYWSRSWSPVVGCTPISPGCANCWASKLAATRLAHLQQYAAWEQGPRVVGGCTRAPSCKGMLFCCIMTDLFHADVHDETIASVLVALEQTSATTIPIVCTKRPERMRRMMGQHAGAWQSKIRCGVTVENRDALARIDILRETTCAGRWLSLEPLLEDLGALDLRHIDWVACGAETGPGARPSNLDWYEQILWQCRAARVPLFFKALPVLGVVTNKIEMWPAALQVRERAW